MSVGSSFIYSDIGNANKDRKKFLGSIEKFFKEIWVSGYQPAINPQRLDRFCHQIAASVRAEQSVDYAYGFPHKDGYPAASVFKKMAYFAVLFCENCPIEGLKDESGEVFTYAQDGARNYENSNYAVNTVLAELFNAEIERKSPEPNVKLSNKVFLTQHSQDALAEILQDYCMSADQDEANFGSLSDQQLRFRTVRRYKQLAFMIEQMAYVCNPDARYKGEANGKTMAVEVV